MRPVDPFVIAAGAGRADRQNPFSAVAGPQMTRLL